MTTQLPFNLKATPTAFTASSECPTDAYDPTDLDPEWAAACPHCLPATPTRTPGGFDYVDRTIEIPMSTEMVFPGFTISTPDESAGTPTVVSSATPTSPFTPTPSPTATAAPFTLDLNFLTGRNGFTVIQYHGDWGSGLGLRIGAAIDSDGFTTGGRLDGYIDVGAILGGTFHVTNGTTVTLDGNGQTYVWSVVGYDDLAWSGHPVTLLNTTGGVASPSVQNTGNGWNGSGYNGVYSTRYLRFKIDGFNGFGGQYNALHLVGYLLSASPTPTFTPSPTGTLAPTSTSLPGSPAPTLDRSFRPQADCRVPVHVHNEPVADVDLNQMTSSCYRLVPEVHLNNDVIVVVHIDVTPIDFCFDFYTLNIKFLGLDIDIAFFVAVGLAFLAVRFGLFSG